MKRLCIYVTYDFKNIADDYIGYMLRELRKVSETLIVICNYSYIVKGIENIQPYADQIYYRENKGFDTGAFKDALCSFIGWSKVLSYDEICLINDSFFGPFIPFEIIFEQMERRANDFWGLIKHAQSYDFENGELPEHIQSFFIVVQSKMLHSDVFQQYWENIPYFKNFDEAVRLHEVKFTQYFKEKGFSYSVLADTNSNDTQNISNNFMQYALISYELMKKRNFPFLKKQQIGYNTLDKQTQENIKQAIVYVDKHTKYDVNLIWDNIIRTMNISDLQRSLHLQYIFSGGVGGKVNYQNIVIAVSANFISACEYVIGYLVRLQPFFDIKVYVMDNRVRKAYEKKGFECIQKQLDTFNEIEKLGNYQYICIIHDEDMSSDKKPSYVHKSHFFNIWENLLKDACFVGQILNQFELETRLGFLAPPSPDFGEYFGELGKGWRELYDQCYKIILDKKIQCVVSQDKAPTVISENFWVRGDVLRDINRFIDIDFGIIKYLWMLLAQEKGFYSGIVESTEYASMSEVNKQYYLNEICNQVREHCGRFDNFLELKKLIFKADLNNFCMRYTKRYIYGTGYMAEQYKDMVSHIDGFIVSDGQPNERSKEGIPILYLSEIVVENDIGVIVCVSEKLQGQIIAQLRRKGINNYICI